MPMAPATIMITDSELSDWIKQNPLFCFRSDNGYALRNVAARMGRSQTTVSKWEDGTAYPTDHNMELIAKLMKIELTDLCQRWRTWYEIKHPSTEQKNNGNKETSKN